MARRSEYVRDKIIDKRRMTDSSAIPNDKAKRMVSQSIQGSNAPSRDAKGAAQVVPQAILHICAKLASHNNTPQRRADESRRIVSSS